MADEVPQHPDSGVENPGIRFEPSDANFCAILYILIAALVLAAVQFAGVWWLFRHYERHEAVIKQSSFPLQPGPSEQLPAGPRLEQVNRVAGIEKGNVYVREEDKERILNGYGATPESGFVHIPIRRAMDFLADKLPARKQSAGNTEKGNGLIDAGEPNSGRMFRGEPRWFER